MKVLSRASVVAAVAIVCFAPPPSDASMHRTVLGSAGFGEHRCILVHAAADRRWLIAYYPTSDPVAAGVCNEDTPHVENVPDCKEIARPGDGIPDPADPATLYASMKIGQTTYRMIFIDRGPSALDEVGLSTEIPLLPDRCGTGEVKPAPVTSGGFTILVLE